MASSLKKTLRNQMRATLLSLSAEAIEAQSSAQNRRVMELEVFRNCKGISIYVPMENELQTYTIIEAAMKAGKRVYIPKITGGSPFDMVMIELSNVNQLDTFPKNKWGISEPPLEMATGGDALILENIDLVLLPGVAFDAQCRRLGHGKGYYDCFLDRLVTTRADKGLASPVMVGMSLSDQVLPHEDAGVAIPMDDHDKYLDYVVAPSAVYSRT